MSERSCSKRIGAALRGRLKDLRRLYGERRGDSDSLSEYGLCFDFVPAGTFEDQKKPYFRYQLSWGGPAEEFRFYIDSQLEPYRIEFWLLDWFDGASEELEGEDFRLLENIFELFREQGLVQLALSGNR